MGQNTLMCVGCGEFVRAVPTDGEPTPLRDECPECDGTAFKDVQSDTMIRTEE